MKWAHIDTMDFPAPGPGERRSPVSDERKRARGRLTLTQSTSGAATVSDPPVTQL